MKMSSSRSSGNVVAFIVSCAASGTWSRRVFAASVRSRRMRLMARLRAVVTSQAPGFAGTPSRGQRVSDLARTDDPDLHPILRVAAVAPRCPDQPPGTTSYSLGLRAPAHRGSHRRRVHLPGECLRGAAESCRGHQFPCAISQLETAGDDSGVHSGLEAVGDRPSLPSTAPTGCLLAPYAVGSWLLGGSNG